MLLEATRGCETGCDHGASSVTDAGLRFPQGRHSFPKISTSYPQLSDFSLVASVDGAGRSLIMTSVLEQPAMRRTRSSNAQILLFPSPCSSLRSESAAEVSTSTFETSGISNVAALEIVISGTYRKDYAGLRAAFEELSDLGFKILSPSSIEITAEVEGFVYMKGEENELPSTIESRHLDALQRSQVVWLHAPNGYVGTSAALEVGFANAIGVPVFSQTPLSDPILRSFVNVVSTPREICTKALSHELPVPKPALDAFQHYYRRVAAQRGYEKENAKDCLILMMEEIGELARAIRKRERLVRSAPSVTRRDFPPLRGHVFSD